MSKAGGLILMVGGMGVAAYLVPSGGERAELAEPPKIEIATPASSAAHGSQGLSGLREAGRTNPGALPSAAPTAQPAAKPSAVPPFVATSEPKPSRSAPVVVTVPARPSEPATRAVQPAATVPVAALARELQKELRRVGCYGGEINGAWTPMTRQAMKAFTDRVNATLPVENPDYILLAMVQNHADKACGKPCPQGQGLTDEGRCMPNAIIAKRGAPPAVIAAPVIKSAPLPTSGWTTTATMAAPTPAPSPVPTPTTSGWATTATTLAPTPTLPSPPVEGRMALSGPKAEEGARLVAVDPSQQPPAGEPAAAAPDQGAVQPRRSSPAPARRSGSSETRPGFGPSFFSRNDRSTM